MAYLEELHWCFGCGKDLGAEDGDGYCGECDEKDDEEIGFEGSDWDNGEFYK